MEPQYWYDAQVRTNDPSRLISAINDDNLIATPNRSPINETDRHPAQKLCWDASHYSSLTTTLDQLPRGYGSASYIVWGAGKVAPSENRRPFSQYVAVPRDANDLWLVFGDDKVKSFYVRPEDRSADAKFIITGERDLPRQRIVGIDTKALAHTDKKLATIIDQYTLAADAYLNRYHKAAAATGMDANRAFALALNETRNTRHSALNWIITIISPDVSVSDKFNACKEFREHAQVWLSDDEMIVATHKLFEGLAEHLTDKGEHELAGAIHPVVRQPSQPSASPRLQAA